MRALKSLAYWSYAKAEDYYVILLAIPLLKFGDNLIVLTD